MHIETKYRTNYVHNKLHYYYVFYLIASEETLGGVDSKCKYYPKFFCFNSIDSLILIPKKVGPAIDSDGWDENSVASKSLMGDNILNMDMEEEAVKINRVEQQHNKNLENNASNKVMAQTKFPAKTHLDVKKKCDGNSLAGSSKKVKNPEQLMKILAKCNKPTRLAGSSSCEKLLVRMKTTSILN